MLVFISVLLIILLLSILYNKIVDKQYIYIVMVAILVLVAGLRYNVGYDYPSYAYSYSIYLNKEFDIFKQPALTIIAIVSDYIYNDYATWFFLMSLITIIPVTITIYKESRYPHLCIIMYILLGCWHFPFNIVKQGVAASIMFCGLKAIMNRNIKEWITYCLVAAMFHVSAILMIPIYYLVTDKIKIKNITIIVLGGVSCWLFYDDLFYLISIIKQGEGLASMRSKTVTESVNFLRIVVNCAPIALFASIHKKCRNQNNIYLFYLSLINMMLNIASMNSIYLNRICCYTNMFNILFIPDLLMCIKNKFIIFVILLLYSIFWGYDIYKTQSLVEFSWIFER